MDRSTGSAKRQLLGTVTACHGRSAVRTQRGAVYTTVAGGKLQGSVLGVRVWNLCSSPENHRPIQASYKLEVHGGEGCKAGAFLHI